MTSIETIRDTVLSILEDAKAKDIQWLDVKELTSIADYMIFCTGTSNRHVRAVAERVREEVKQQGVPILGMEGEETCEWILLDLGVIVIHVMQQEARDFYQLEKLWNFKPAVLEKAN